MIKIKAQQGSWIGEFEAPAVPNVGDMVFMQPDQEPKTVSAVMWTRSTDEPNSPMTPHIVF